MLNKLNIGAGRYQLPDYISVDLYHPKAEVMAPAWELPYEDNTACAIYCSHMMEHLEGEQLAWTLQEFRRVLAPVGVMELITPDLEKAIRYFLRANRDGREHALSRIFGHQRKEGDTHYTGFWKERWMCLLPQYGFDILEIRNQESRFKVPESYIKESDLYVKAIKK